ncbi:unnamed protein product [Ilex paraguariensis]|uniref:Uncharacterized protein n=1 Tax=Ilex paraguariensis TaxID=185542 RepID=A0ABC8SEH4_9AQUA
MLRTTWDPRELFEQERLKAFHWSKAPLLSVLINNFLQAIIFQDVEEQQNFDCVMDIKGKTKVEDEGRLMESNFVYDLKDLNSFLDPHDELLLNKLREFEDAFYVSKSLMLEEARMGLFMEQHDKGEMEILYGNWEGERAFNEFSLAINCGVNLEGKMSKQKPGDGILVPSSLSIDLPPQSPIVSPIPNSISASISTKNENSRTFIGSINSRCGVLFIPKRGKT